MDRLARHGEEHTLAVQQTCTDASTCKQSAAVKGYFDDPFVQYFVRKPQRKMPLINRGYYARVQVLQDLIDQFLSDNVAVKKQIVVLGAGHDTTYFKLKANNKAPHAYFELDFPSINLQKICAIQKNEKLWRLLMFESADAFRSAVNPDCTSFSAEGYHLISCDLRDVGRTQELLQQKGIDPKLPTLVISECVFIYMESRHSIGLILWFKQYFDDICMIVYEQILPDDAFGQTMIRNIQARGCDLLSIADYPDKEAQKRRFLDLGFEVAECFDMNELYYGFLELEDRKRKEKLEFFDELEEYHLLQGHYCIVVAKKLYTSSIRCSIQPTSESIVPATARSIINPCAE